MSFGYAGLALAVTLLVTSGSHSATAWVAACVLGFVLGMTLGHAVARRTRRV